MSVRMAFKPREVQTAQWFWRTSKSQRVGEMVKLCIVKLNFARANGRYGRCLGHTTSIAQAEGAPKDQ